MPPFSLPPYIALTVLTGHTVWGKLFNFNLNTRIAAKTGALRALRMPHNVARRQHERVLPSYWTYLPRPATDISHGSSNFVERCAIGLVIISFDAADARQRSSAICNYLESFRHLRLQSCRCLNNSNGYFVMGIALKLAYLRIVCSRMKIWSCPFWSHFLYWFLVCEMIK